MPDKIKEIVERVKQIGSNFPILLEQMNEAKEWNSFYKIRDNITKIIDLITNVVVIIELTSREMGGLSSEEKRKAAVQYLDEMIKLPWFFEVVDGPAIDLILSIVVDFLNRSLGHEWQESTMFSFLKAPTDVEYAIIIPEENEAPKA